LLSPRPESLLAFEPMWARLAEHAHLVAIDLPGFGHSQRRDALLSPRAMGEFIIRAADAFGLAAKSHSRPPRNHETLGGAERPVLHALAHLIRVPA
jgi:pimeloyl-ACP methyl ester carboxylesterase